MKKEEKKANKEQEHKTIWSPGNAKRCEEILAQLPPIIDHVKIAAVLLKGKSVASCNETQAARQALTLWEHCSQERKNYAFLKDLSERSVIKVKESKAKNKIIEPKSFPVNLADFKRIVLPKNRTEDRAKIFREFARDLIINSPHLSGTNVEQKQLGTTNGDCANFLNELFADGLDRKNFYDIAKKVRRFADSYKQQIARIARKSAGINSGLKKTLNKCAFLDNQKKDALLKHFPSISDLRSASLMELKKILPSNLDAENLLKFLNPKIVPSY